MRTLTRWHAPVTMALLQHLPLHVSSLDLILVFNERRRYELSLRFGYRLPHVLNMRCIDVCQRVWKKVRSLMCLSTD